MSNKTYPYVIVGGGLAGVSAIKGIRQMDTIREILMISSEPHLPYHRPPLTKQLWSGANTVDDIFVHDRDYYSDNGVELALSNTITSLNPRNNTVTDCRGQTISFEKLLLATGGLPKPLTIPGADLPGLTYFRKLDDYLTLCHEARDRASAVVIGGGFIGAEIAAALNINHLAVTMVFPDSYICQHLFPLDLARAMQERYRNRGVRIFAEDRPIVITRENGYFVVRTQRGQQIEADLVIIGAGIEPATRLAEAARLAVDDGVVVNEYFQSSCQDIYAAGDIASFPYTALGSRKRIEHWDGAASQGELAGLNMAGADEPYTHMPYFFSDMFDFGYQAVGEINSQLDTVADWQEEYDTGVIYYLTNGQIRGVMTCNMPDRLDAAREMIRGKERVGSESLSGMMHHT